MSKAKILGFKDERIAYKEIIATNADGEIVSDVFVKPKVSQNGSGFVISYTEKMSDFIAKCNVGATVRVFLYIAHHQSYGVDGMFGYRCSHKFLQQVLNLDRKSIYNALRYLKDNFLVHEDKIDGCTEFMVNPQYVTVGGDKKARIVEWNLRWERYWKKVNSKV